MAKCKVISHRGANRVAPQNTIPAFKKSLEIGCDGFETDIHLTVDGHPVICHNYTIDETSNGSGEVKSKTLEELRSYDFGSYFSDELAQAQTSKKIFLEQIERIIPWDQWLEIIKPCYYKGERGNKPYDSKLMLRIHIL